MEFYNCLTRCFFDMVKHINEPAQQEFMGISERSLSKYQLGFGSWIRMKYLKTNGKLYRAFCEMGIDDIDVMSLYVMRGFHGFLIERKRFYSTITRRMKRNYIQKNGE